VSFGQAEGVVRWQSGFFETGLGAGDVIGNPAVDEQTLLEVVEHIAGPRIIITGLADAADIHGVAFLGIQECGFFGWLERAAGVCFGIFLPNQWHVRVAIEADECGLCGKVRLGLRFLFDVVELGGLVERGVGECDGIDIGCDRLGMQPGFLGFVELLVGKLKRLADRDVPVLVGDFFGQEKHGFMVAENGDGTGIHDTLHTHGRFRTVAHGVAETENSLHGKLLDVGKHGFKGVDVRVDIAEDGEEGVLGFRHGFSNGLTTEHTEGRDEA